MPARLDIVAPDESLLLDFAQTYYRRLFQRVFDRSYFEENPYYCDGNSWETLLDEPHCTQRFASIIRMMEVVQTMLRKRGWTVRVTREEVIEDLDRQGLYHVMPFTKKKSGPQLFSAESSFQRTMDRLCEAGVIAPATRGSKERESSNRVENESFRLDPAIAQDPRSLLNDLPEKKRRLALRYQQLEIYRELAREAYYVLGRDPAEVEMDMGQRLRERDPWVVIPPKMFKDVPVPPASRERPIEHDE